MSRELLDFAPIYESVRAILAESRRRAYTQVNAVMVEAYWRIGQRITEQKQQGQERAGYGEALIRELSRRLGDEFGRGFSVANLKNFRQFYRTFPELGKGYALRSELSWTKYLRVLPSEEELARELEARHVLEIRENGGEE